MVHLNFKIKFWLFKMPTFLICYLDSFKLDNVLDYFNFTTIVPTI